MPESINAIAARIRKRDISPVELVDHCLQQIDRLESTVKAWVFVDRERAYAQAKQLADELARGQDRGPLHGIPVGIKDIFDVFDWPTAAGSALWKDSIARADSTAVKKLRQAGAVFLGKTVTTQFASFDPPATRNPWNLERTPGGSSSGSAAAVAAKMCVAAMGSQTGGSITRPAAFCGVAGCKPTYGRVGLAGVLPLAPSMDHPGPIANCVSDLALLQQIISGPDSQDPTATMKPQREYSIEVQQSNERPVLGLLRGLFDRRADPAVRRLMENVQTCLRLKGAGIVPVGLPASFSEVLPRHRTIMAVEAAAFHRDRLQRHPEDYQPCIRSLLEEGLNCPAPEYARCKDHQRQLKSDILVCFQIAPVLLAPATLGPAPDLSTTGDPAFNSPWSYTGLPVVSIPAGWTNDGMPLSIQLIGQPWEEAELFAVAAWCEEVLAFEERELLAQPRT